MRDIHSDLTAVKLLGPAVLDADANSGWIDLQGYDSAEIVLMIGAGGITFTSTNKVEFVLEHADATDQSDSAAVAVTDLLGVASVTSGIVKALKAAHASAAVYRLGYKGGKRYIRLTADFGGTHSTGTPLAAALLKGHAFDAPAAAQI